MIVALCDLDAIPCCGASCFRNSFLPIPQHGNLSSHHQRVATPSEIHCLVLMGPKILQPRHLEHGAHMGRTVSTIENHLPASLATHLQIIRTQMIRRYPLLDPGYPVASRISFNSISPASSLPASFRCTLQLRVGKCPNLTCEPPNQPGPGATPLLTYLLAFSGWKKPNITDIHHLPCICVCVCVIRHVYVCVCICSCLGHRD